jgi:hypothetical protein
VGTSREIREALDFFGVFEVVAADGGVELAGSDLKINKFLSKRKIFLPCPALTLLENCCPI